MFSAKKQFDFSYGHRLLDYDGKCAHVHGHNGRAEIEVATAVLDSRGMVVDFGDIRVAVKGWIDQELDHKMLLRSDDPLVPVLRQMGEPVFEMDSNPTAENIAKAIFDRARAQGLPVVAVRLWETPDSVAEYKGN